MKKKAEKEIPEKIKEAFNGLSEFKGQIERLGMRDGIEWFTFSFAPVNGYIPDTGFPLVYGLKGETVHEINGVEALEMVGSFFKD